MSNLSQRQERCHFEVSSHGNTVLFSESLPHLLANPLEKPKIPEEKLHGSARLDGGNAQRHPFRDPSFSFRMTGPGRNAGIQQAKQYLSKLIFKKKPHSCTKLLLNL
jgi:hypothetical protein